MSIRGFTLIEILVVVLLIGLGLGVSLTLDFAASPQQQAQQAQLLVNELELAAQDAVLDNKVLGLDFFSTPDMQTNGWRWLRLDEAAWHTHQVHDAAEQALLPAGITLTLESSGQTLLPEPLVDLAALPAGAEFAPEILLLPTRELTPFTLTLSDNDGNVSVITADLMGRVRIDEDAPTPP